MPAVQQSLRGHRMLSWFRRPTAPCVHWTELPHRHRPSRNVRLAVELLEDRLAPSITTIVSAKPTPSTFGDAVTFTATVTEVGANVLPTGNVEFRDGVAILGSQ